MDSRHTRHDHLLEFDYCTHSSSEWVLQIVRLYFASFSWQYYFQLSYSCNRGQHYSGSIWWRQPYSSLHLDTDCLLCFLEELSVRPPNTRCDYIVDWNCYFEYHASYPGPDFCLKKHLEFSTNNHWVQASSFKHSYCWSLTESPMEPDFKPHFI